MLRRISRPLAHVTARHVLIVVAAGAAVRLLTLRLPRLWYDEATVGIMGLAVLRGEWPIYFFGQPFMGALDAYLAAPLYVALGVSARTLELLPVLLAIAWLGLVVRLAWDAFGPRAALFTALALAVPPDFLLYWSHEARPVYPLTLLLGTLALALALRVPEATRPRAVVLLGLLGLVLGVAFWTNFLSLVYFPPVAVLVVASGLRRILPAALVAVPAFLLGSLPHWLYGLPHSTALPPPGHRIGLPDLLRHLRLAARVSWPILSGVPAEMRDTAAGLLLASALALGYGAALAVAAGAIRRGPPPARRASLALLVLAAVNVGVAVGTQYGRGLDDHDQRYFLPLYTALLPLLGLGLARLPGWRAAAVLVGALLLVHTAGTVNGSFRDLAPAVAASERTGIRARHDTIAALERDGPRRLYSLEVDTRIFTFLSGERLIFSNHYEEVYPPHVRLVDGAERVGWWVGGPYRDRPFEANLAAVGIRFAYRRYEPLGGAYQDFAVPETALRELDPARFTVTAGDNPSQASFMVDRDAATVWRSARPKRGGEWIQVDLGAIEPVALVRWLPGTYQEVPDGLRLEASRDGGAWQALIDLPAYMGPLYWSAGRPMVRVRSGRVELRVPPTPARYLRVTQTGRHAVWRWSVRELFVYATADAPAPALPRGDGLALARAVRAAGVTHLYADHGWGARVALADPDLRILPANLALDAYGFQGPAAAFLPRFHWGPERGVLLESADASGFALAARASGLGFSRARLDGLELFTHAAPYPRPGRPLPATDLRVTASRQTERAALAIDGDPRTRWATAGPRAAGDWLRVDLVSPRLVRAVRLWTAYATDLPRGLRLEGSEDGAAWRPLAGEVTREGSLRWGGVTLLGDGVQGVRLDFATVTLRALRLTLTRGDPVFDWSIHELSVYGAE